MKTFYWDEETLEYFKNIEFNERLNLMMDFVENECDLEEGETVEMLYNDLNRQVLNYKK